MNGFDIAAAIVICLFLIKGIIRGFVKEIASIFGLIISFALASHFYSSGAEFFDPFIETTSYRDVLGFVLVFLSVYIIVVVIGLLLNKIVKTTMTKPLNVTLGALVGLLKGVFLAALLLLVVSAFVATDEPLLRDSRSRSLLRHAADNMIKLTPENLRKQFEAKKKKLLAPTALNTDKRTIPVRDAPSNENL